MGIIDQQFKNLRGKVKVMETKVNEKGKKIRIIKIIKPSKKSRENTSLE